MGYVETNSAKAQQHHSKASGLAPTGCEGALGGALVRSASQSGPTDPVEAASSPDVGDLTKVLRGLDLNAPHGAINVYRGTPVFDLYRNATRLSKRRACVARAIEGQGCFLSAYRQYLMSLVPMTSPRGATGGALQLAQWLQLGP
jgi:hypothetical protein